MSTFSLFHTRNQREKCVQDSIKIGLNDLIRGFPGIRSLSKAYPSICYCEIDGMVRVHILNPCVHGFMIPNIDHFSNDLCTFKCAYLLDFSEPILVSTR